MKWGSRTSTAGTADSKSNKMLVWLAWLLATCGFGILLGGVASMQQACGGTTINMLTQGGGGTVGYLAPVSCDHFFQYTWWITFLHWFVWLMVLIYLVSGVLHKTRIALVGLCAVASVLLMGTANTFLMFNYIPGLTGTMATRTRVTVAGAIVSAVADLLLMLLIGWDAEKDMYHREEHFTHATAVVPPPGTVPMGTATTTTTVPAATAV